MGLFFYTKKGSIISTVDLPTTEIIEPKKIEEHVLFYFLSYLNPIALIETITVEIDIRTAAMRGSI